jgi:type II secretory pathway pseudopilin PulG
VTAGWVVAAVVVGFVALAVGTAYQRQQAAEKAYRQQVLELRHEYQRLLEEVATVRDAAAEPPARLYLGGDDQLDLILDLSQPEVVAWPGGNLPSSRDPGQKAPDFRSATYEP